MKKEFVDTQNLKYSIGSLHKIKARINTLQKQLTL